MTVIADTHFHMYPCYNLDSSLRYLWKNLSSHGYADAQKAAFLVERHDCHFFDELAAGAVKTNEIESQSILESACLCIKFGDCSDDMLVFAGRQIVTAERIEILGLTMISSVPDGLSANETVAAILESSGTPVLAWAPGKWLFKRAAVVEKLFEEFAPGQLLVGDTALRPIIWAEPVLMRKARLSGFTVVAGSDPLPFAGEETRMGGYATMLRGQINALYPVTTVRRLLGVKNADTTLVGKRCGPFSAAYRVIRMMLKQRC
ncbi:MAG: hypothetical protein JXN60_03840 [Lentisphaerae bacterium]|nr:hypothetical protein [Lentisphaerota bacterium]